MRTIQIYYIIIVILIVIILWQIFKSSNENFTCSPPNYVYAEKAYETIKNNNQYKSLQKPILDFINCYKNNGNLSILNTETNLDNYCMSEVRNNLKKCGDSCKTEMKQDFKSAHRPLRRLVNEILDQYDTYKQCMGNLSCAQTLTPVFSDLKKAYKKYSKEYPNVNKYMDNYSKCNIDFINNNTLLNNAKSELNMCLSQSKNYCDDNCINKVSEIEGKDNHIANLISTTNTECGNNFLNF